MSTARSALVRDSFITNICGLELQREYLRKEMSAAEMLETAMAWERGRKDQGSIAQASCQKQSNKSVLSGALNASNATAPSNDAATVITVNTEPVKAFQRTGQERRTTPNSPLDCKNCGNQFEPNHPQRCPAKRQSCRKCGKYDHFVHVITGVQICNRAKHGGRARPIESERKPTARTVQANEVHSSERGHG